MAQELGIAWKVDTSGLTRGMQQSTDLVTSNAGAMERSFASAGNVMQGLEGNIKGMTSTMRSEGRIVGFWANDIAKLSGAGKEAKEVLGDLGGMVMGLGAGPVGWIMASVEGMSLLRTYFQGLKEDQAKLTEQEVKATEVTNKHLDAEITQLESIGKHLDTNKSKYVEEEAEQARYLAQVLVGNAQVEVERLKSRAADLQANPGGGQQQIIARATEHKTVLVQLQAAEVALTEAEEKLQRVSVAGSNAVSEAKDKEAKARKKAADTAIKAADQIAEAEARAIEAHRASNDYQPELESGRGAGFVGEMQAKDAAQAALNANTARYAELMALVNEREEQNILTQEENDKADKAEATAIKQKTQLYSEYAARAGAALGGIATGQLKVGQAFAQMGQEAIQIIAEMMIRSVTAHALGAGAGAAESQAAIPIVGPALAIAAMAAMISQVMGLLGSAEGGADLPAFSGSRLFQLHSEEMVLPRSLANTVRSAVGDDGGSAGGGMHFHFNGPVYDRNGVVQAVEDHWQDFQRLVAKKTLDRKGI